MKYMWMLCFLVGCISIPERPDIDRPVESLFPEQEWTDFVHEQVMKHELHKVDVSDGEQWCPNGMSVNNWVKLVSAMSYRESGHRPELEYRENFKNSRGEWVISTGLMQISLESARQRAYQCRDFLHTQSDLHDPIKNLRCSMNILSYWVKKDKRVGGYKLGAGKYWSVMRNSESIKKTKKVLQPVCE